MFSIVGFFLRFVIRLAAIGVVGLALVLIYLDASLPNAAEIREVKLQIPLKIYSAEDKLIAEFGEMRRTPVAFKDVPPILVKAVLATEDARFYEHSGVDFKSLGRAAVAVVSSGNKSQGGSTITMQVARNYFLTRQKTFLRKVNEILLAWRIEKEFTKDEILELYLNKIYFGKRAYGIAAAAEVYYGKKINELSLAQMAMLAGLPQAPSVINPINNTEAAFKRRNHVLDRMLHYGFITPSSYYDAQKTPVDEATYHVTARDMNADYVAEMVRMALYSQFGDALYSSGYSVKTTIHSDLQQAGVKAVQTGLLAYDKRHGYRGPVTEFSPETLASNDDIEEALADIPEYGSLEVACLVDIKKNQALLKDGSHVTLDPSKSSLWPKKDALLKTGDVVYLEHTSDGYILSQLPAASSALVSMDPNNGQILALVGGFDFGMSKFNRAIQATRQPGSSFKPFVYAAALDSGFSPASIINDAPVMLDNIDPNNEWRPQNVTREFYGPTRLREALVHSRNLVSIRLLQAVGIRRAIRFLEKFGFQHEKLVPNLSLALGTNVVTPLELTSAYSIFANGGYKILPYIIEEVRDGTGAVVLKTKVSPLCETCTPPNPGFKPLEEEDAMFILAPENETDSGMPVISPQVVYIMNTMLQDVIKEGTGKKALALNRKDLAGKTGTTNDQMDAWFAGFNGDVVTTAWVGFDEPKSLDEYGADAALPIWIDFMQVALANKPDHAMIEPPGLIAEKIDPETGLLARKDQRNAKLEYFISGTEPTSVATTNNAWRNNPPAQSAEGLF